MSHDLNYSYVIKLKPYQTLKRVSLQQIRLLKTLPWQKT